MARRGGTLVNFDGSSRGDGIVRVHRAIAQAIVSGPPPIHTVTPSPLPQPTPPEPPPMPKQPYPSEPEWAIPIYLQEIRHRYTAVGQTVHDETALVRGLRAGYDIGSGVPKEAAMAKHLEELNRELGLVPAPTPPELARLIPQGGFFQLESGARHTVIQCSDFRLYHRFLAGEDLRPVLQQRQDVGFNDLRIFLMADWMFRLYPQDKPWFYDRLPEFGALLASYGLRGTLVAFADTKIVMPHPFDQTTHWRFVGHAVRGLPNIRLSAVNENDQHENEVAALNDLPKIEGVLCSQGSNGSDILPPRPWMDFEEMHWNDVFEWQRKVGHNTRELTIGDPNGAYEGSGMPAEASENTRFPDKDSSVAHAEDAASGAALLCAGACFHSVRGKTSEMWDGHELACAEAWVRGAQSVPLEFQAGSYIRRDDLLTPDLLRVYERRFFDGRGHIVRIRK